MNFGQALDALNRGCKVNRIKWNNPRFLFLKQNDLVIPLEDRRISLRLEDDIIFENWYGSQEDLMATDWQIVNSKN